MSLPCAGITIIVFNYREILRFHIGLLRNSPFSVREGSEAEGAVVNDSPVGCQSRDLTEPQRDHDPPLQFKICNSAINRKL